MKTNVCPYCNGTGLEEDDYTGSIKESLFLKYFWSVYDKKVGRYRTEKKWLRLSNSERVAIVDHVPKFVKATPDKAFRPNPLTYLNGRMWEDEDLPERAERQQDKLMTQREVLDDANRRRIYHRIFTHYTEAGKDRTGKPLFKYGRA